MQLQFNAGDFEPSMGMEPWPDGWHDVIIQAIEPRKTKTEGAGMLGLVLQNAQGKQQFLGLNLWNPSAQAVEIANKTLSAITYVTIGATQNRLTFLDTNELLNIPFKVLVSRQKDDASRNNFTAFKDARGNDPKGGNASAGPAAPHAPAAPAFAAPAAAPAPAFAPQAPLAPAAPAASPWPPQGGAPAAAPAPAFAAPAAAAAAAPAPAQSPWPPQGAAPAAAPAPAGPSGTPAWAQPR